MFFYNIVGIDRKTGERVEVQLKTNEPNIGKIWRQVNKVTNVKVTSVERVESDVRP